MNKAATPVLIMTGVSFANEFLDHGLDATELRILLGGGIAAVLTSLASGVEGLGDVVAMLAWVALAGYAVVPVRPGQPTPVIRLLERVTSGG